MSPQCASLLSHQHCRHHPSLSPCPVSQHRRVSGFVPVALLCSFCCAVSFGGCHLLNPRKMLRADVVGARRSKAAAPSCPRKIRAVLWVQPVLTGHSGGVTNSAGTATSQRLPQAQQEPQPRLSHCHAASFLTVLSHQSLTFKITISITSLPITVRPEW